MKTIYLLNGPNLDLLGKRQNTQNIEISAGITVFFWTPCANLLLPSPSPSRWPERCR